MLSFEKMKKVFNTIENIIPEQDFSFIEFIQSSFLWSNCKTIHLDVKYSHKNHNVLYFVHIHESSSL